MKTKAFFLVVIFMAFSLAGFTTVYTVSNLPQGGSQYTNLFDAYNAASDGDTLILEGTNIPYIFPSANYWSKQLTVIGAGFNTSKHNFKKTIITQNTWSYAFPLGYLPNGSSFYGISFSGRRCKN